jgi:hypothetical protein
VFGEAKPTDSRHHDLSLLVSHDLELAHVQVFDATTGRLVDARLRLEAEAVANQAHDKLYVAELPGAAPDWWAEVAILAPESGVSSVGLPPADVQALHRLPVASYAVVTDVASHGLDLDGDGKADVAIVSLCFGASPDDTTCNHTSVYAVRRTARGWQLTELCSEPPEAGPCKP